MMIPLPLRRVFADLDPRTAGDSDAVGWATTSLLGSIRRVVLLVAVAWQAIMIWATLSTLGADGWPLITAQLGCVAVALLAIRNRVPEAVVPLWMGGIGYWSLLSGNDLSTALSFSACWEINFSSCLAGLLILRRWVLALVLAPALANFVVMLVATDLPVQFAVSVVVTQTSIILALRLGLLALLDAARDADLAAAEAERSTRSAELVRRESARIAEETRVLHDTAINTLGAIANGGAGVRDERRVGEQCARDVALLEALRGERSSPGITGLHEVFGQPGLPIVRSGLDDEAVERLSRSLPDTVVAGVVGCVREAVTNATKHSGAESIAIELLVADGALTVRVQDDGVGIAGALPVGRGIERSIVGRAGDYGFEAEVVSAPGEGVAVSLRVPLGAGAGAGSGSDEGEVGQRLGVGDGPGVQRDSIAALTGRAGELWSLGVIAVSVVLTLGGGQNVGLALFPMIGIMLLAWAAARLLPRALGAVRATVLVACTCAIFFLSAAATGFGSVGAVHWQALAPTGAFVLVLAQDRPGRGRGILGAAVWAALCLLLAGRTLPIDPVAAQIVLIAGCVGLGFSAVWAAFQVFVGRLGAATLRSQQEAFAARLRADLDTAAQAGYRRWVEAGLDSAVQLLREVAEGRRAPGDPGTRDAAGAEESYLRQLVQIGPELVHLGRELMPAMRYARERDVDFVLRIGGADAPDEFSARDIAGVVLHNLSVVGAGEAVRASLFPVSGGVQLTLTGRGLSVPEPSRVEARHERLGAVEVLEIIYAASTGAVGTGPRIPAGA